MHGYCYSASSTVASIVRQVQNVEEFVHGCASRTEGARVMVIWFNSQYMARAELCDTLPPTEQALRQETSRPSRKGQVGELVISGPAAREVADTLLYQYTDVVQHVHSDPADSAADSTPIITIEFSEAMDSGQCPCIIELLEYMDAFHTSHGIVGAICHHCTPPIKDARKDM